MSPRRLARECSREIFQCSRKCARSIFTCLVFTCVVSWPLKHEEGRFHRQGGGGYNGSGYSPKTSCSHKVWLGAARPAKSGKIRQIPSKSGKIRQNPSNSSKIRPNPAVPTWVVPSPDPLISKLCQGWILESQSFGRSELLGLVGCLGFPGDLLLPSASSCVPVRGMGRNGTASCCSDTSGKKKLRRAKWG